jgi:hypothetical protein
MHRRRSAWFFVAICCLGVAFLGSGCERTISDSDGFFNPDPGPDPNPDPGDGTNPGDGDFQDDL